MTSSADALRSSYTFALDDAGWLPFLNEQGFVVIKGAMSPQEVEEARSLLWLEMESNPAPNWQKGGAVGTKPHRDDPSTWDSVYATMSGINARLAQSAGAWYVRGIPSIKHAFARIWGDDDLLVSMDCALLWRPWWLNPKWKPRTEGLHLDQNPFHKPHRDCVQGMVPLYHVDDRVGGLQVVPGSHTDEEKAKQKADHPRLQSCGDFCLLSGDDSLERRALLLHAGPGDLILWDSRTVHGGLVGTGEAPDTQLPPTLARLTCTVAMTPRSRASPEVIRLRLEGFEKGINFNHTPHEAGTSSGTVRSVVRKGFVPPSLTPHQRALLGEEIDLSSVKGAAKDAIQEGETKAVKEKKKRRRGGMKRKVKNPMLLSILMPRRRGRRS